MDIDRESAKVALLIPVLANISVRQILILIFKSHTPVFLLYGDHPCHPDSFWKAPYYENSCNKAHGLFIRCSKVLRD